MFQKAASLEAKFLIRTFATMKKVAIIGAGPAGLTAAYLLSKEIGKSIEQVKVFEASEKLGGMSASLRLWNQTVDLGPHRFFSFDQKVNSLWLEIAGDNYTEVSRLTRIYYRGKFFHYPLKAFNAIFQLGFFRSFIAIGSYFLQKIAPSKDNSTFEGWVTRRFGRKLYETFFKTYSEKLWGIECSQLDADFASQRIKKLSLGAAIRSTFSSRSKNKHQTLADTFRYPNSGTGWLYEEMAKRATQNGAHIHLGNPISSVVCSENKAIAIVLPNGTIEHFDAIVSTMPLNQLLDGIAEAPSYVKQAASKLQFRNTILVYLHIDTTNLFPDQWMYIHSKELQTGRITNFRNWVPSLYGNEQSSIIAMEYWCFDTDAIWTESNEKLIALAIDEIEKSGLLKNAAVLNGHVVRLHKSYPVYFSHYRKVLKPIEEYLTSIEGLYPIGRYGSYKYNNQDHSLLMGMLAAENIAKNTHHNLWNVNTNYGKYLEK